METKNQTQKGVKKEVCYKCGKEKGASTNLMENPFFKKPDVQMYQMAYGVNFGKWRCHNCSEAA